jgi:hypothetical protein
MMSPKTWQLMSMKQREVKGNPPHGFDVFTASQYGFEVFMASLHLKKSATTASWKSCTHTKKNHDRSPQPLVLILEKENIHARENW